MALRDARLIDDKIVYALNNSVPTASFKGLINATQKCAELHKQVRICKYSVSRIFINKARLLYLGQF